MKFLLAQNDDGNIRALFERLFIVEGTGYSVVEPSELNEDAERYKGIWEDFALKGNWNYQSVHKLEERMRAALVKKTLQCEVLVRGWAGGSVSEAEAMGRGRC